MPPIAQPRDPPSQPPIGKGFSSHFMASETSVRSFLGDLRRWLEDAKIPSEAQGTMELVLAESLNNIVEHAYAETGKGHVQVEVRRHETHLSFVLRDEGLALPANQIPSGTLPNHDCTMDDLPEGGFGWFLILSLTQRLSYNRRTGQNRLCFDIMTNEAESG